MKFRVVEDITLDEDVLSEATLSNIEAKIRAAIAGQPGINPTIRMDSSKKWYILTTTNGNEYCIPIKELVNKTSTDYKKLRYDGDGTVRNGEIYDLTGKHIGRAYFGVQNNHTHRDYDDINLQQYGKYPAANGTGVSLNQFISDANAGKI